MDLTRRNFLRFLGLSSGAGMLGRPRKSHAVRIPAGSDDRLGVLSDLSKCVGCRVCEEACNEANKLPEPKIPFDEESIFEEIRRPTVDAYTVVNRFPNPNPEGDPVYVKRQCMHCNEPACASACLVNAFTKTPEGSVIYNEKVCIGCRYCIMACPFYIPAYSYSSAFRPAVLKCTMCYERISKEGGVPACVESCPEEAVIFGKRRDLIHIAMERIRNDSEYIDHIYGEREVGGTSWMYISKVPFEKLGFPTNLETTPPIAHAKGFLWAVPLVLVTWPALLMGCHEFSKSRDKHAGEAAVDLQEKES
ncbi:MAG: 4Fe-4S dicluster domain-containing protein [Deltaproteobacteria bacterium]|nr:4Fe-4S dicluster domain-containing protein [Deltaproteobacteria bacterium]